MDQLNKLRKFFKKKSTEGTFSRLGEGHRLGDSVQSTSLPPTIPPPTQTAQSSSKHLSTKQSARANKIAEAAMERLQSKNKKPARPISAELKREVEANKRAEEEAEEQRERFNQKMVAMDKAPVLSSVRFECPTLFGQSLVGSYGEVNQRITDYLMTELTDNACEASTLLFMRGIYASKPPPSSPDLPVAEQPTASEWREKRRQHFLRILTNLIQSPENPTFRRLRLRNKLIWDLLAIGGADLFLQACHFTRQELPVVTAEDTTETEPVLVMSEEEARDVNHLQQMFDLLNTAKPILPELNHDTKVFKISGTLPLLMSREQLPDDFFYVTKEEVKRQLEQQQRIIEESGMLLTKAMRERLKIHEIHLYRFALIRVRFPGNLILQGTFHATDKLGTVRIWITDCLLLPTTEFKLWAPPGLLPTRRTSVSSARVELTDDNANLTELCLSPCCLLNLSVDTSVEKQPALVRPELVANAIPM